MSWRLIIIILGFAAAGFYGAAQAADEVTAGNQEGWAIRAASDFPDPAPEYAWWSLGWNQKLTTSQCIGKNTSPLCVIETQLACEARRDIELCRKARNNPRYEEKDFGRIPRTGLLIYNLWSITKFSERAISDITRAYTFSRTDFYQPGDMVYSIAWGMCGRARNGKLSDCCVPYDNNGAFVVRKVNAEWVLVGRHVFFRDWQGYEVESNNKKVAAKYPGTPIPMVDCFRKGVGVLSNGS